MKLFKKKEQKLSKNMLKFIEHQHKFFEDHGKNPFYPPITDPQLVVDCLCDLILGENYYIEDPVSTGQANTIILHEILTKYCKAYREYE